MGYKINLVDAKTSTNKNVKEDDLKIKIGVDGDDTQSKHNRKYLPKLMT